MIVRRGNTVGFLIKVEERWEEEEEMVSSLTHTLPVSDRVNKFHYQVV